MRIQHTLICLPTTCSGVGFISLRDCTWQLPGGISGIPLVVSRSSSKPHTITGSWWRPLGLLEGTLKTWVRFRGIQSLKIGRYMWQWRPRERRGSRERRGLKQWPLEDRVLHPWNLRVRGSRRRPLGVTGGSWRAV